MFVSLNKVKDLKARVVGKMRETKSGQAVGDVEAETDPQWRWRQGPRPPRARSQAGEQNKFMKE
jgi:hypothetical protein